MPFQPTQTEQEYEVTRERIPATPAYMSIYDRLGMVPENGLLVILLDYYRNNEEKNVSKFVFSL